MKASRRREQRRDNGINRQSSALLRRDVIGSMAGDSSKPVLYINVVIHSAKAAVQRQVRKTMDTDQLLTRALPPKLKSVVARHAGHFVGETLVGVQKLVDQMIPKLCTDLPQKLEQEKGLSLDIIPVFTEGPYFVLQVQIRHVDKKKMAQEQEGRLKRWFVQRMPPNYLESLIQSKLASSMGDALRKQFQKKEMEADAHVLNETEQARFFYAQLAQVQQPGRRRPYQTSSSTTSAENGIIDDDDDLNGKATERRRYRKNQPRIGEADRVEVLYHSTANSASPSVSQSSKRR